MIIDVSGRSKNIRQIEVKYLLEFYGNILLGNKLSKNIIIHFEHLSLNGGDIGTSTPIDYDERNNNHREFFMGIEKSLPYDKQIRVIGHEMEHVRQYARGELTCSHWCFMRWKGLTYNLTDDTYPYVPWEKEARKSEGWLQYFYQEHCRINNLVF